MKNLLLGLFMILGIVFTSQAQTVGILIQPNFDEEVAKKGFFAEVPVFQSLGVYSDYKFHSQTYEVVDLSMRQESHQLNVGLSYALQDQIKLVASTSVINDLKSVTTSYNEDTEVYESYRFKDKGKQMYQLGVLVQAGYISGLVAYENNVDFSSNRLTFGIGLNF